LRALHDAVEQGARSFARDLTSFIAVASGMKICVVLPEVAHLSEVDNTNRDLARRWQRTYARIPPDTVLRGYARYRAVIDSVADVMGALVIPTADFDLNRPDAYADGEAMHFSATGSARMGRGVADTLIAWRLWDEKGHCRRH
jgi:hypothetical protein